MPDENEQMIRTSGAAAEALTAALVDYAGIFPPAKLTLSDALANYRRYLSSAERALLGAFICPAGKLREACTILGEAASQARFSVLPGFSEEPQALAAEFAAAGKELDEAAAEFGAERISALELKLTEDAAQRLEERGGVTDLVSTLASFNTQFERGVPAYIEIVYPEGQRVAPSWQEGVVKLVVVLSELRNELGAPLGFKLRCGGPRAEDVPSAAQLAFAINQCRETGLPAKFTAGLHHACSSLNSVGEVKEHGFLNVFCSAALAHAKKLEFPELIGLLQDGAAEHFNFVEDELRWSGHSITAEQIAAAREQLALSFGSCSFEEPVAELRKLGLLKSSS